jgi:hypothetical protein
MRWWLGTGFLLLLGGTTPVLEPTAFFGPEPVAECRSCHPAESDEWQASRHAAAWIDPVFQSEFARGRPAWCVSCHAPLAADPTAPDGPAADQGVACAGCHQKGGRMVSARRGARSPHDTAVDPSFGSPGFCAGCHEFNFPVLGHQGRLVRYTDEPMQATVSQWRASRLSPEVGCTDCHGASPAGHAFRGSHDPELVAAAIDVDLCRDGGAIEVALANRGAGHNVPSGGVHRRIVLRAWTSTAPERMAERTLGRRFRPLAGGGKQTLSDTTLAPGAVQRHRFDLAALGRDRPVNLELRYIYALDERADLPTDVSRVIWQRRTDPSSLARCSTRVGE